MDRIQDLEKRTDTVRRPGMGPKELMEAYTKRQTSDIPYEQLSKLDFHNIDASEPSDALSRDAEAKHVYTKLFNCFMTEKNTPGLQTDEYDGVTTAGCFVENHLPVGSLDEMVRIVRPGGIIVIETRLKYLTLVESYRDKLEPYMERLEREGKWTRITREVIPNYFANDEGILWVFRVC